MRLILSIGIAAGVAAGAAVAQDKACKNEIRVEVRGLRQTAAPVLVGVYASAAQWLRTGALEAKVDLGAAASAGLGTLPPGEYAASAFQDLNGNGQLDTNFIGIPTEPFAFSSGAVGFMGPPKFEQARFKVDACGATVVLDFTGSD